MKLGVNGNEYGLRLNVQLFSCYVQALRMA